MLKPEDILPGIEIVHIPMQNFYRITEVGLMKQQDGSWVRAARYYPLEDQDKIFYRAVTEFHHFQKVNPS